MFTTLTWLRYPNVLVYKNPADGNYDVVVSGEMPTPTIEEILEDFDFVGVKLGPMLAVREYFYPELSQCYDGCAESNLGGDDAMRETVTPTGENSDAESAIECPF